MIKQLIIPLTLLLAVGCNTMKEVRKTFAENKVEMVTDFASADKETKKSLLVMVFNDGDRAYDDPITRSMKIDTSKSDAGTYKYLCNDFLVVKLHRSELEQLLKDVDKFEHKETIREDYKELDPKKSFAFLCSYKYLQLYGARTLDSKKDWLHDLVLIGWGP